MKVINLKCSSCGSSLEVPDSKQQCKCSYCGAVVLIQKPETETKNKVLPLDKLLSRTAKLEGDGNEFKAMELYDKFLETEPNNPYVLFARSFVSLMDTDEDDFNMELFKEYFNKGLNFIENDKMEILDFIMYRYIRYTIPSMQVWQQYAYDKLKDIDRREASLRFTRNMRHLFDILKTINDMVDSANFEKLSKSYINEYKDFKCGIVEFCSDMIEYVDIYDLKFSFFEKIEIKKYLAQEKKKYKKFVRTYKN